MQHQITIMMHIAKEDIGDIRTKLISRLPDKRICEMASVLIIDTKYDMYVLCVDVKRLDDFVE